MDVQIAYAAMIKSRLNPQGGEIPAEEKTQRNRHSLLFNHGKVYKGKRNAWNKPLIIDIEASSQGTISTVGLSQLDRITTLMDLQSKWKENQEKQNTEFMQTIKKIIVNREAMTVDVRKVTTNMGKIINAVAEMSKGYIMVQKVIAKIASKMGIETKFAGTNEMEHILNSLKEEYTFQSQETMEVDPANKKRLHEEVNGMAKT